MADINHVVLVGRLTRDAELKYTANGQAVCKFSIAVNRRRKNGDQWEDEANYLTWFFGAGRVKQSTSFCRKASPSELRANCARINGSRTDRPVTRSRSSQITCSYWAAAPVLRAPATGTAGLLTIPDRVFRAIAAGSRRLRRMTVLPMIFHFN